jgi:hypothetical protein
MRPPASKNDSESCCITMSVVQLSHHSEVRTTKTYKRRVSFELTEDGSIAQYEISACRHSQCQEIVPDAVWIESTEWKAMRKSAALIANTVCNDDHIWSAPMDQGYIATVESVFKLTAHRQQIPDSLREDLNFWTCVGLSRRGLENYILPRSYRRERSRRRRKVVESVMYIQEECWGVGMNKNRASQLICTASEKFSRPGRAFAAILAAADASAVQDKKFKESPFDSMR